MTINEIRDILLTVTDEVYHYRAPKEKPDRYIVWGETGADNRFSSDDKVDEIAITGEIHYYTKAEYDITFDDICNVLSENQISWAIIAIGYDDALGQLIYQLSWEVPCGKGQLYQ